MTSRTIVASFMLAMAAATAIVIAWVTIVFALIIIVVIIIARVNARVTKRHKDRAWIDRAVCELEINRRLHLLGAEITDLTKAFIEIALSDINRYTSGKLDQVHIAVAIFVLTTIMRNGRKVIINNSAHNQWAAIL